VHFRLADLPEAKEHALTALGLHESAAQPDHQRTAANLLDLSQIRLELSEFDEALGDAQRSLAIRQSAAGACPELSGLSLEALGCVQWRLGAWPQARESLEQSLALLEAAFGDGNGVCARVRTLYGLVLRDASLGDLGQLAQAESMLRRAHLVLTRGHGADHPDTVSAEIHLADTRRRMAVARRRRDGDQQDFERACGQVARRYEQVMGRLPMQAKKPGRACALVRYGHVLNNLGRNEQARALVQEARGIYIQGCGADHPYVAEALTRLIGIEQDLGNPSGARHAAHEARRIYVWRYGPQHPYVHQIDAFLADPEHGGRD
jgi:tetratricopeptide (TPR) repeat protein